MADSFERAVREYLASLGAPEPTVARAVSFTRYWRGVVTVPFDGVFVSEYVTEAGVREYQNLWLFSPVAAVECHSFVSAWRADIATLRLEQVEVGMTDYQPGRATAESRMSVQVRFSNDLQGTFQASGVNCEALQRVIVERFVPKLEVGEIR